MFDFSLFFLIIYFSYIFIYLCVYGCVCVCVCAGGQRLTQGNGLSFHHMAPGDQTAGCTAWHQTPFSVSHLHDPNTFFFFSLKNEGGERVLHDVEESCRISSHLENIRR